jgi:hypothetical protein
MRIGTVLAVATMLSWSPALAEDLLLVEPCHSIRLQYDKDIREVHIADETLAGATVAVQNPKLLIFSAKPRTTTQVLQGGNQTITTSECGNATGSTNLLVLDGDGNEILPSTPPITSNEVLVQWHRRIVYVNRVAYKCLPNRCVRL